jgi:hypothetical protein
VLAFCVVTDHAIEHGGSRGGRWLRARRTRFAAWIAVVEGILIVVHAIGRWPALIVALAVLATYLVAGRNLRSDTGRQAFWIAAASQGLVALVPVLWFFNKALAIVVVAVVAVFALIVLFTERR